MIGIWMWAVACKKAPPVEPAPAPEPVEQPAPVPVAQPDPDPEPGTVIVVWPDDVKAMHRALSARDPEPVCADVEEMSEAPLEALLYIVEKIDMPPTAPMRAANCVVARHADSATGSLIAWTTDPGTLGLAKVVTQHLDTLPLAVAVSVVEAGLAGPHADVVQEALAASSRAELKDLTAAP